MTLHKALASLECVVVCPALITQPCCLSIRVPNVCSTHITSLYRRRPTIIIMTSAKGEERVKEETELSLKLADFFHRSLLQVNEK